MMITLPKMCQSQYGQPPSVAATFVLLSLMRFGQRIVVVSRSSDIKETWTGDKLGL
jgi:hypothetical protein